MMWLLEKYLQYVLFKLNGQIWGFHFERLIIFTNMDQKRSWTLKVTLVQFLLKAVAKHKWVD